MTIFVYHDFLCCWCLIPNVAQVIAGSAIAPNAQVLTIDVVLCLSGGWKLSWFCLQMFKRQAVLYVVVNLGEFLSRVMRCTERDTVPRSFVICTFLLLCFRYHTTIYGVTIWQWSTQTVITHGELLYIHVDEVIENTSSTLSCQVDSVWQYILNVLLQLVPCIWRH